MNFHALMIMSILVAFVILESVADAGFLWHRKSKAISASSSNSEDSCKDADSDDCDTCCKKIHKDYEGHRFYMMKGRWECNCIWPH